jgi:hypothetical protein
MGLLDRLRGKPPEPGVAPAPPVPLEHLTMMLAQLDARLGYQREEWDGLDRKGTNILATTGVVLGLVVNNAKAFQAYPDPAPIVYAAALAVLAAGLAAGVATLWPRDFKVVPEPKGLLGYADKDSAFTVGTLITTKADAFTHNRGPLLWKTRTVRAQMLLLAIAAGLMFVILWYWR